MAKTRKGEKMTTNYKRGRAFEYKTKKLYEALGCLVFRTAGSRSPFDLIALHPKSKMIYLLQCKKTATKKQILEFNRAHAHLAGNYGVAIVFLHKGDKKKGKKNVKKT